MKTESAVRKPTACVHVVDDDTGMRNSLSDLLRSVGHDVRVYSEAAEYLKSERPDVPGCLILDIRLPGISGLDFQDRLAQAGVEVPIIFITGHGDIPMSVRAMKAGAVEFLVKPFREQEILDSVTVAIQQDRRRRAEKNDLAELERLYIALTPREQQIFQLIAGGMINKQIAARLGISEVTVKVHRGNLMRKMRAASLLSLVRMADQIGVPRDEAGEF